MHIPGLGMAVSGLGMAVSRPETEKSLKGKYSFHLKASQQYVYKKLFQYLGNHLVCRKQFLLASYHILQHYLTLGNLRLSGNSNEGD